MMESHSTENSCDTQSRGQRNKHGCTKQQIYRLLRLTPFIFVVAGSVLTVVGNTASLKSCKIAGPVVITAGGLLLLFITVWILRQDELNENTNCAEEPVNTNEQNFNQFVSGEASNDQLGPIHHFEISIPSKSPGQEIVPPSYEEAVSNNNK